MRFIPVEKAKIKINDNAFVKDKEGLYGYGKLIKKEEDEKGMKFTFIVANPDIERYTTTEITEVCIPKPETE